ncbi:MAG: hypothetical protein SFW08_00725 [Gemmatimonadaceae bacterium]|nr:hypothetical protein [Gemmatimonadaceae bacterium]
MTTPSVSVSPELAALLALQEHDAQMHALESRAAELAPRREALQRERDALAAQLAKSRDSAEGERKKAREASRRLAEARLRLAQHVAVLEAAERLRDVTAASEQVEYDRKLVAQEEADSAAAAKRAAEAEALRTRLEAQLTALDARQATARAELEAEVSSLDAALAPARAAREAAAAAVPSTLLSPYDRVRRRKPGQAVVALRGAACGACDTALPLQRFRQMVAAMRLEVCEGCGVLLFATAPA